jgi:hypothetical protein
VTRLDSLTVADELVRYVNQKLAASSFFSDFRAGKPSLNELQNIFAQYYLWRNQFHRWFGICIAKSPPFGTDFDTSFVLSELIEHIEEEIKGDHHGMCVAFLNAIGISDTSAIELSPVTAAYSDSFITRYMDAERTGEETLAALAGREIVAPARNRIIIEVLSQRYGVISGLEFFDLHEELEVEHFKSLWDALVKGYSASAERLVDAAHQEISDHVDFWDDTYALARALQRTGAVS